MIRKRIILYLVFGLAIVANLAFWTESRERRTLWRNVPPVPSERGAASAGLGDSQFAYRAQGLMLQNLGDTGGRSTALAEYDYAALERWFFLADRLDPRSDYIPMLAAWYYGASQDKDRIAHVVNYLEAVGQRPEGEKWRWLAQAVYLAQHVMKDTNRALALANLLAASTNPDLPNWARTMPALILTARGDKEAAYAIMMGILASRADRLDPAEVNNMRIYICEQILDATARAKHPLCADPKAKN